MNTSKKFILLGLLSLLFCCADKSTNPIENDAIIATGSYLDTTVDKNEFGDFLLVLKLEKSTFSYKGSINVKVYFENIGSKQITLDGILPYRNTANPPRVNIWSVDETLRFEIFETLADLLNDSKITIHTRQSVMLMSFDLTNVNGFLLEKDTSGIGYSAKELENVYLSFKKGSYKITTDFWPTPQIYRSNTDTLTFTIK
jgi:hypothetical protein